MNETFTFEDALIILRRRILYFLIPFLVIAPIGVLVVALLPPQYTARGVILVESQQIPEEMIRSTVNSYAQERIQVIRQRVITRARLLEVDAKYNVYPKRLGLSETERVDRMRRALQVTPITTQNAQRRGFEDGTYAFEVAYTHRDPDTANAVANEFMTLFLSEDARARTSGATNTTEFFRQEATRLRETVSALEDRIARFKAENADALPENLDLVRKQLTDAQGDIATNNTSIMLLEEERRAIENQMTTVIASASAGDEATDIARLKAQLAALRADKTDNHPDVRALRDQIASVERSLGPSAAMQRLRDALVAAEADLRAVREAETVDEAQLAASLAAVKTARDAFNDQLAREAASGSGGLVTAQLQSRIDIVNSRIDSLNAQNDELRRLIRQYEDQIGRTPNVERGLATLLRDYKSMSEQYQQLQAKQNEAVIAENLQQNQKAEKFSVLEPAARPDKPSSPERGKLSVFAVFLALMAGGGAAFAAEFLFATVRGRDHLTGLMGEPPLAVVPYIEVEGERRRKTSRRRDSAPPDPAMAA